MRVAEYCRVVPRVAVRVGVLAAFRSRPVTAVEPLAVLMSA
jgi:hypothetical protein